MNKFLKDNRSSLEGPLPSSLKLETRMSGNPNSTIMGITQWKTRVESYGHGILRGYASQSDLLYMA